MAYKVRGYLGNDKDTFNFYIKLLKSKILCSRLLLWSPSTFEYKTFQFKGTGKAFLRQVKKFEKATL